MGEHVTGTREQNEGGHFSIATAGHIKEIHSDKVFLLMVKLCFELVNSFNKRDDRNKRAAAIKSYRYDAFPLCDRHIDLTINLLSSQIKQ